LAGEREFGIAGLVRGHELGHAPERVLHRLYRLTAELGLDRERARGWTIVQTLAWAVDDGGEVSYEQVECARWLVEES
jgi:streptomycin 6-kinase